MYKELVGCGSVITYVRKDFEQDREFFVLMLDFTRSPWLQKVDVDRIKPHEHDAHDEKGDESNEEVKEGSD